MSSLFQFACKEAVLLFYILKLIACAATFLSKRDGNLGEA